MRAAGGSSTMVAGQAASAWSHHPRWLCLPSFSQPTWMTAVLAATIVDEAVEGATIADEPSAARIMAFKMP